VRLICVPKKNITYNDKVYRNKCHKYHYYIAEVLKVTYKGVNRRNLIFINLKHTLKTGVSVRIKFKSEKIVSLARSCSKSADDVWGQAQINTSKEMLERGKRAKQIKRESKRVDTVICFTEVRFQRT
jgi:hypothetical protein